jgi:phosphoglycerate dehydrogenase-like enzyme
MDRSAAEPIAAVSSAPAAAAPGVVAPVRVALPPVARGKRTPPLSTCRFLHVAVARVSCSLAHPSFRNAIEALGPLTIIEDGARLSDDQMAALVREHEVYLAGWGSRRLPLSLAGDRGKLRYICGITGAMREFVPIELIEAGIPLTNWGDAPANGVAEGAMALLLACVKDLHYRVQRIRDGAWRPAPGHGGTLSGLDVGIYGCGVIGRRFVELLQPFRPVIRIYDPYVETLPPHCQRAGSLVELFQRSQAIVIHAALSSETENSVTADLLAMLPDSGIIVNTARGAIIDQDALFAELSRGRLRAALDVTAPEELPRDHPVRKLDNLILTAHCIEHGWPRQHGDSNLENAERVCLENLRRFVAGKPLKFLMDAQRYRRST